MMTKNTTINFSEIIDELLDNSKPFSPVHLHRFSDLTPTDLDALKNVWEQIDPNRRAALMEDLEELNDADTMVCFDDLSFHAIQDEDARVRATAIRLLWETNTTQFSRQLINILENDPDETVRSAAASGLGNYIYLGEIEEIPEHQFKEVELALLRAFESKDKVLVRRKSLEGLGYSSHKKVQGMIRNAFASSNLEWRMSALYAMGRSASKHWKDLVTQALQDEEPEVRYEAVRAAGELELKGTRQILLEMLLDPDNRDDQDIRQAVIWSVSQIGGEKVREALAALLEQAEDDEEEEFITTAIENLGLTEGMNVFGTLEIDLDDEDQEDDADYFDDDEDDS